MGRPPADDAPAIDIRGLVKAFSGARAVAGIDLRVAAGERVGLLGPNGAGKTTTLLTLLGVIRADAGDIRVLGHRMPRRRSAAMERVGFVAGYLPLPENLTVRESLALFAGFAGLRRPGPVIAQTAEAFGLVPLLPRRVQGLSSGQRTLVSIVKAVLHRPALLVLDEPTASLDPDIAARIRETLLQVHRRDGTALLVTSHNMREVEMLCERVVLLSRGQVVADGAPAQVAGQFAVEDLEAAFLAVAASSRAEPATYGAGGAREEGVPR